MDNHVCPRCGTGIADRRRTALSRVPREGEPREYVCPWCGMEEALEQFAGVLVDWRSTRKGKA